MQAYDDNLLVEHRRPKAAMRSPIPIEPVHSFSYGHLRQRLMARRRVRTYDDDDDENVAQHGTHTGQLMSCIHLCNLILEIQYVTLNVMVNVKCYVKLTAVKSRYLLTSTL